MDPAFATLLAVGITGLLGLGTTFLANWNQSKNAAAERASYEARAREGRDEARRQQLRAEKQKVYSELAEAIEVFTVQSGLWGGGDLNSVPLQETADRLAAANARAQLLAPPPCEMQPREQLHA